MNQPRRKPALKLVEAMRLLGVNTRSALARELGITRQAVSQWGKHVPELMQYRIEDRLRRRDAEAEHSA